MLSRENLRFRRTPKPWETVESRRIASLGDLRLHRDRIVSKTGFQMVHPRLFVDDFSIVIPVLGRDKPVMIWNYRHAIQGWELELPAGHIADGESPEAWMVSALSRVIFPEGVCPSCPQPESRILASGALRGWYGSSDSQPTGCV